MADENEEAQDSVVSEIDRLIEEMSEEPAVEEVENVELKAVKDEVNKMKAIFFASTPEGRFYLDIKKTIPSITPDTATELYRNMQMQSMKGRAAQPGDADTSLDEDAAELCDTWGLTKEQYTAENKDLALEVPVYPDIMVKEYKKGRAR